MDTEAEASCEIDLEAEVDRVIEKEIKEDKIVVIPLNKNESFTCDECGKSKKTLKQLLDHKRVHKSIKLHEIYLHITATTFVFVEIHSPPCTAT